MAAAKKVEAKIKRLKERAFDLMRHQKYLQAVDVYEQLMKLDEDNGEWPRRAADCHWHLKNEDQRLKYSLLAARAYSETGLMLKAIAMCKVVLSIDPNHKETQQKLAELHSQRPHVRIRPQPEGVTRQGEANSGPGILGNPSPVRGHSVRPTTQKGDDRKANRARARMAAAAALRQARALKRKDAIAATREKRAASTLESEGSRAASEEPAIRDSNKIPNASESAASSPSSTFTPPVEPVIPALHLEAPRTATPTPGLDSLTLRQRVPTKHLDSLPPAPGKGNVYSLTLADVPDAEFSTNGVPSIQAPVPSSRDLVFVPIIPPHDEEEDSPDSIDVRDISFGTRLSKDRLELTQRDFADIPLLSELAPNVLRQLITDVAMVELQTNEVLFNEGDPADAMYVVVEGSVTAVTLPHRDKPIQLAHLLEGEFFGEIGLMSDQPRGATVSAHEPTRLLRFDRDIVAILIEQDPTFLATLLQFLKDRLVEDLMMSSPLFALFNEQERYDLAEQFEFLEIEPDSVLLERGQHPIGMYVLLTGEATMKGASEAGTVRRLGPGDIFGEQALLNNEMSRVEVRTSTKSFALCLPSDAFPEVVMTHPAVLEYLGALSESSKGELDVAEDFLDHIRFF